MAALGTNKVKQAPARGWDMGTNARESRANPSLAEGCSPTSNTDAGTTATGSPGGVLGTGSNTDRYTPGVEGVG